MSETLNNMFSENANQEATASARSLAGTAQLTATASRFTAECLKKIEADFENYKDKVAASKVDHSAMDALISEDLQDVNVDFLKALDEATLDGMLKSQQSKRSRSKGKVMTMDNYKTMMTAAFAENLIRIATGNTKNSTGPRRFAGQVDYTAEQLAELANDQEKLRREIRNVQSKKSIMKSKEGFSEDDARWAELLKAEEQLKDIRTDAPRTVRVDETKTRLTELLAQVSDINHMKPADAKRLLEDIKALTESEKVAEPDQQETTDEEI